MFYSIPSYNFSSLMAAVTKFNFKASKMGMEGLTISNVGTKMVETFDDNMVVKKYVEYTEFDLVGEIPVINGWKIVAAIDHLNGVNIINKFPGIEQEIPVEFYDRKPYCEHCNSYKIKKQSILIQNLSTQEYKHVGKTCLKDFFNKDVDSFIAYYGSMMDLISSIDSEYSERISGEYSYNIREILHIAFCSIRQWGYVKSAEEGSTKNSIYSFFGPSYKYFEFEESDWTNVELAIEWLATQSPSDFINNLNNLVKAEYISNKHFGYVAGLAGCYLKSISEKREKVAINNEFTGTVGKRDNFTVSLLNKIAIQSFYGVSYLHIFLDNTAHKLSWFASKDSDMEVGNTYKIKGTVKSHKEYKGENQTQLTRVAMI